ncbi:MAG: hypothetical protein ABIO36_07705 [Pyrinomonadaceae bacterium]
MEGIFSIDEFRTGQIYSWSEITTIHKIRRGIYQSNGHLISLLTDFGRINSCYPDEQGDSDSTIFYTGNGRRGDQKLDAQNRALVEAVTSKTEVPLFNKLAVGKWQFMGYWRVVYAVYIFDEKQSRMVWKFTLQKLELPA